MTKIYIVEAQYLLPVYRHVRVLANSAEAAIAATKAEEERTSSFWEEAKEDFDNAREVTFDIFEEENVPEDLLTDDYDLKAESTEEPV